MKKHMMKSAFSIVVSVALVTTLTPSVAFAQTEAPEKADEATEPLVDAEAAEDEPIVLLDQGEKAAFTAISNSWDSYANATWFQGPGRYAISTPEQLAYISAALSTQSFAGSTFYLTNDIYLNQTNANGEPLLWEAKTDGAFEGTIDGQGFGIYGMTSTSSRAALFGKVENAAFYNLEIEGSATAGVAAAFAGSANNSTFQNCVSSVSVTGTSATGLVGGLVGYASNCSFLGCQNAGRVSGPARAAGGIVGESVGSNFEVCFNEQAVQGAIRSGGIVGSMALPTGVSGYSTFLRCANQAAISAEQFAGGLIGVAVAQTTMSQSYNRSLVEGGSYSFTDAAYAGGLIGYVAQSESTLTVEQSFNSGMAWAVATGATSHAFAGGIVGGTGSRFAIEQSYNTGNANATMAQSCASGAFVGYSRASGQSSERNCYWLNTAPKQANGSNVRVVPVAIPVAPSELRTIVPYLGTSFAYSAYANGAPELAWTTNTAELCYLSSNGSTVLERVGIQEGASVSGSDIARLYCGEVPAKWVDGQALRFLGWSTSSGGKVGEAISHASGVLYVYPVYEKPAAEPTQPAQTTQPNQWILSHGSWWYRHGDGSFTRNAWEHINGAWYHFDADGWMQTGWLKLGSTWYYLNSNGAMAEGWKSIDSVWYYFTPSDGAMRTGWLKLGSTWYYLHGNGAMATGWVKVGVKWYYLNSNGAMAEGWKRVDGIWYYLTPSDGAMHTGWLKLGSTWYYLRSNGAMATGWLNIGGAWYFFNDSGEWRA